MGLRALGPTYWYGISDTMDLDTVCMPSVKIKRIKNRLTRNKVILRILLFSWLSMKAHWCAVWYELVVASCLNNNSCAVTSHVQYSIIQYQFLYYTVPWVNEWLVINKTYIHHTSTNTDTTTMDPVGILWGFFGHVSHHYLTLFPIVHSKNHMMDLPFPHKHQIAKTLTVAIMFWGMQVLVCADGSNSM